MFIISMCIHVLVKLNFKCRIQIQNEYSYEIAQNFIFATSWMIFFSQAYILKSSILDTPRCMVWLKYYRNGLKHEVLNKSISFDLQGHCEHVFHRKHLFVPLDSKSLNFAHTIYLGSFKFKLKKLLPIHVHLVWTHLGSCVDEQWWLVHFELSTHS